MAINCTQDPQFVMVSNETAHELYTERLPAAPPLGKYNSQIILCPLVIQLTIIHSFIIGKQIYPSKNLERCNYDVDDLEKHTIGKM